MNELQPVDSYETDEAWLIGARTNLMGRFSPQVERILVPPARVTGGTLISSKNAGITLSYSSIAAPKKQLAAHLLDRLRGRKFTLEGDTWAIELRRPWIPENWSHSLNHLLLQSLRTRTVFSGPAEGKRFAVILPSRIPRYIIDLYQFFDFETVITDLPVEGNVCTFTEEPFLSHRAAMAALVRDYVHPTPAGAKILAAGSNLPRKVFVSRRDTRTITNESEIEALLASKGFRKVYPETLSVVDQFALFAHATHIVGIHGAGLAPLAFRQIGSACQLVEILTPGHMTDFFRMIAHQVGATWVGVRGRLWPELVEHAYDFRTPFKRYSLTAFSVDPDSVEVALQLAADEAR